MAVVRTARMFSLPQVALTHLARLTGSAWSQTAPSPIGKARPCGIADNPRDHSLANRCRRDPKAAHRFCRQCPVIERLCAEAMTRAQRQLFALLTEELDPLRSDQRFQDCFLVPIC
jgi:hypothetical protein